MTTTRGVRPTDLVSLLLMANNRVHNEACTWDRVGWPARPTRTLVLAAPPWFPLGPRRRTWISRDGRRIRGVISARPRRASTAWEIDCLIVTTMADGGRSALRLFDRLSAAAARAGVQKLFLRLHAGSDLLAPAIAAGFAPYLSERLLRLDAPLGDVPPLAADLTLRPRERADEFPLFRLYNRVAPPAVRMVEAANLAEWKAATERRGGGRGGADVVAERDGRIVAHLQTGRVRGGRLEVVVAPEAWPDTDALIGWGIRDLGAARPVFALMPTYALPVIERALAAGFADIDEFTVLARRIAQPIRLGHPIRFSYVLRPVTKPVATA